MHQCSFQFFDGFISGFYVESRNNAISISFSLDVTLQKIPLLMHLSKVNQMEYFILYTEASSQHYISV